MPHNRLTPTADRLRAAIGIYLFPRMATDAAVPALIPVVQDVSRANFGSMRSKIAARIRVATRGKIAQDATLDDLLELLDAFEENEEGEDDLEEEDSPDLFNHERGAEPRQPGSEDRRRKARDEESYSPAPNRTAPFNGMTEVENREPIDARDRRMQLDRHAARYKRVMDTYRRGRDMTEEYDLNQDRRRRARDEDFEGVMNEDRRRAHDSALSPFYKRFPKAARIGTSGSGPQGHPQNYTASNVRLAFDAGKPSGRSFLDRVPSAKRVGSW
jgi:hypothetical protein